MGLFPKRRRRPTTLSSALAFAGAAATDEASAAVRPKSPGETKIVAIMGGDRGHNAVPLEYHVRSIFAPKKDWRLIFVLSSRFFTPGLIEDADLLITSRHSRPDDIDWRTDGLAETMETGALLWSDENVKAIVDNVRNRGMGFLALHNTIACGNRAIVDLLGIEPVPHNEVQPLWVRNLNSDHPITQGLGDFFINLDEQFAVVVKSEYSTTLFETAAMHDKRNAVGGWCLENGKGRIVGLLPGHLRWAYRTRHYREMLWRAAHWAMNRYIPPYTGT